MKNTDIDLVNLLSIRQNYEKLVKEKLLHFCCFFHSYMWDGSDVNPHDPKFLSDEDYAIIEILSDKMFHMILNIGSPMSVFDLLTSISERKIKHWQTNELFYGGDAKWKQKGYQLKTKDELNRSRRNNEYVKDVPYISGHFRWNNRGYVLSRVATDAIKDYLLTLSEINY